MPLAPSKVKILVWDAPTRVFHWLLALCFAGAYLTADFDRLLGVHLTLGYTMLGLVAFRLAWGLIGTRYARFANFLRSPKEVARYAGHLLSSKAEHPVGHNPLGSVSIVLMLLSTLFIVLSGWLYVSGGPKLIKEFHEGTAAFMLAVVAVHVAGVLFASLMERQNLARSMLNGYKLGYAEQAIRWTWWPVATMLLAGAVAFWWLQWQSPLPA
ncbi:MAG: cytochrome B [Comamonadaceae bacterium CG_4_9_14_3_um_filter_60_33]|nr:MAG: cytochrome B [Comamonadaceae bacterium CG2_30_59_20]PIY27856.1 MAG: cytochrome B [Comamonadaceae bacterium CG_4_10_14_3_um_filter_60_42]PJB40890.1 MAG: cytochrome B [Comamonadaceae bacterium CG_4_9_14_3_um_filter_60_33]